MKLAFYYLLLISLLLGLCQAQPVAAQRLANQYAIEFLRGPGTYVLVDGTTGQGDLQFKTRNESILYIDRKQRVPAAQVTCFTIAGHTLWPHGTFHFSYGIHSYEAQNAFIEYADTTGSLQVAVYYTAEPTGGMTTYFTTFLLRPRGSQRFIVGLDNDHKWRRTDRERLAPYFAQWPAVQDAILDGTVTFENFLAYVRSTH